MTKLLILIFFSIEFIISLQLALQVPENEILSETIKRPLVNTSCIKCICETFTGCNLAIDCNGYTCGPFRISKSYWQDAGSLKLPTNDSDILLVPKNDQAYQNCTKDYRCSVNTIQSYMGKYAIDCTDDDQIDCFDFALLHYFGKDNCYNGLPLYFWKSLNECLIRADVFAKS